VKKIIFGIMLTLLLIGMLTLAFNIQPVKSEPTTWTVDDDGPADFHTIQEAVDAASDGDTVYVKEGTYYPPSGPVYSPVVSIVKSISLIGENRDTTILDGGWEVYAVDVIYVRDSNNVLIKNFTIQNAGSRYYTYAGIYLMNCINAKIQNNLIINNPNGICLESTSNCRISGNQIIANDCGIFIGGSQNNNIYGNNISENGWGISLGLSMTDPAPNPSPNNSIYHNNFINNGNQADAAEYSVNIWDNGYPLGGNYWSDYTGIDEKSGPDQDQIGSDGIGDTPYIIDADNRDRYPLMGPAHAKIIVQGQTYCTIHTTSRANDGS